ncbi:Serine/threonine-protein kinase TOR [Capsicum baccatum]|uniref:Serine/threonine-protein kinase TOR n=1 Tax=Capsicum baccatum TaxID=33114 RepID=A0A2G2VC22_CAPBA|nr:Serine/threonine-protein kinase TOR [Capsicum baccatum]
MGSSSQAIRYPVATTSAGNIDALSRVLVDLCTRSNPKDGAALTLRRLVEEEACDLSGEAFARFMDHLYERITIFLDNHEVSENLGALRVLASKVLGHLSRSGGAMTADEVKVSLEWLRGERIEYRRFAAVLILKEMAENASTVFNVHVPEFVDAIWVTLRDPTLAVQEKAIEALRACLRVIEKCEIRWRVHWYYRMFEATQDGLGRNAPVHSIHGSLLAVGELLRPSLEALAYVGNISKSMGPTMEPHVRGLLDSMFSSGLSLTLVEALKQITELVCVELS